MRSPCPCGHPWDEHDGMGDCRHLDGRTSTGFCERCPHAQSYGTAVSGGEEGR